MLEAAEWSLNLLEPTDSSTVLPDGLTIDQLQSGSDKGKYQVTQERTWSVSDVVVADGKASCTIRCNETGKYPQMFIGNTVYEGDVAEDEEGKNHTSFANVPLDLDATMTFAVKSSYASVVVYKLTTSLDEAALAKRLYTPAVALKKATGAKKALKVKWAKAQNPSVYQTNFTDSWDVDEAGLPREKTLTATMEPPQKVTGYQLQYATAKTFKKAKTVTVKGAAKTSKKISKLKAKKRYYVRVRTYTKTAASTWYSSWSKAKSAKTKKK